MVYIGVFAVGTGGVSYSWISVFLISGWAGAEFSIGLEHIFNRSLYFSRL